MNANREAVFECKYASVAEQRTAHVRAWNLREAIELFAAELHGDGVEERGLITARPLGATDVSQTAYPLA